MVMGSRQLSEPITPLPMSRGRQSQSPAPNANGRRISAAQSWLRCTAWIIRYRTCSIILLRLPARRWETSGTAVERITSTRLD